MTGRILNGFSKKLDFRNLNTINVCNEDYYNLTGLSYDQFKDLVVFRLFPKYSSIYSRDHWSFTLKNYGRTDGKINIAHILNNILKSNAEGIFLYLAGTAKAK